MLLHLASFFKFRFQFFFLISFFFNFLFFRNSAFLGQTASVFGLSLLIFCLTFAIVLFCALSSTLRTFFDVLEDESDCNDRFTQFLAFFTQRFFEFSQHFCLSASWKNKKENVFL